MKAKYNKYVTVECSLKVGTKVEISKGLLGKTAGISTVTYVKYDPHYAGAFKVKVKDYKDWFSIKWIK